MPRTASSRFPIEIVLARVREAVSRFADAAMFELAAAGYRTVFHQLVGCVLSIRTRDEVSLPAALRLFARAPTPVALAALAPRTIDTLIRDVTFHERKAQQVREIARRAEQEFGGTLPCDADVLLSFAGVGPKCANLAFGVACAGERISVDVHVWRITNRWGFISAPTPEQAMVALEQVLPRRYWIEINRLLVPFGKHICTGIRPHCSTCPVREWCARVGVTEHR